MPDEQQQADDSVAIVLKGPDGEIKQEENA